MRVPPHFHPMFYGGSSETKFAFYNINKGEMKENIAQTAFAKEARYRAMAIVKGPPKRRKTEEQHRSVLYRSGLYASLS